MSNMFHILTVLWVTCYSTNILRAQRQPSNAMEAVATQLVSTTNVDGKITYHLNVDALELLTSINEPFDIISVIGQARKGKSFTLNSMIQQISGLAIHPFETSGSMDVCTYGIWMYILPTCSSDHKRPLLFLDLEGSDTETDDQSLRYATILTLLSSQTYLFLHHKLYKHDVDHIHYIQTVISKMNSEHMNFKIDDLNLGVLIREPLKVDNLDTKINSDLNKYFTKDNFNTFTSVHAIPSININKQGFERSISNIIEYIAIEKQSKMKWMTGNHIKVLLLDIVEQLNNNQDLSTICIACP
eukprot:41168_1